MEKGKIAPDMNSRHARAGFTLIEMMVVIAILGILLGIAVQSLVGRTRTLNIRDCAQKLAADIRHARASAMSEGRRTQLVITDTGTLKDLGNGENALWMTFLDTYPPAGTYASGVKVLSCSSCASGIRIESVSGIASLSGIMWFSAIGTLKETAIDKSIIITDATNNSYKVRIYITSLTGFVRVQTCTVTGAVSCSNNSDWHDI